MQLTDSATEAGLDDVMAAFTSVLETSEDSRRMRIAEGVKKAANAAVGGQSRRSWVLALNLLAYLARQQEWQSIWPAARATALALEDGRPGADIPFVRLWAERQLALAADMMRRVGRSGNMKERIAAVKRQLEEPNH